jgi:hypothetical protein
MERTRFPKVNPTPQISQNEEQSKQENQPFFPAYNLQDEPLVLEKSLLDLLLKQENPGDLIALYIFYYYTAKWQHTHKVRATTAYTMKGLHWTVAKVRKNKEKLISLYLIQDIVQTDKITGKIVGHYVYIFLKNGAKNHTPDFSTGGFSLGVEKPAPNALIDSNLNAFEEKDIYKKNALTSSSPKTGEDEEEEKAKQPAIYENITTSQFNQFWELYPRKISQGKALTEWKRICSKPAKERPSWKQIRVAVLKQSRTDQWKNPIYIPHPATWLHQCRWLDDPEQMNGQKEITTPVRVQNVVGFREEGKVYRRTDIVI